MMVRGMLKLIVDSIEVFDRLVEQQSYYMLLRLLKLSAQKMELQYLKFHGTQQN